MNQNKYYLETSMATVSKQLLMLTILFILTCIPILSFSCPLHQKQALLHFKRTIISSSTASHQLKSWNPTSDCCSWERVNCTGTKTIAELHLDGLVAPLPEFNPVPVFSNILAPLFHIRSLKLLDISNNSLHGEIPGDGFANLTELVHLNMHYNHFNGTIPRQLFWLTNLRYLDMSKNSLQGELGPELRSLQNLTKLVLYVNRFHGPIPPQLFELKFLQVLHLSNNNLNGVLSPEVAKLQNLETLLLKGDLLSGKIPEEVGNLTKLRVFSLQNNYFSGGIPSSIVNLKKLEILDLSENHFSKQIPNSIGRLPNMNALDLSQNTFTGQIPSCIQNLSNLEVLRLHSNMLSGEIPTWLFKISILRTLFIGGQGTNLFWNNKAKVVPECSLYEISMPYCGISGKIPELVSSQKDLFSLDLTGNKLEGRIPDWLGESKLEILFLSENKLRGMIPQSLFESEHLYVLQLSQNNLSGKLPENIGNAKSIAYLSLFENNFSGQIPPSISKCENLEHLDLSKNRFSSVNFSLWGDNSQLTSLDLSYNNLSGRIPTIFPKGIEVLYLGGNKFSGKLPLNLTKLVKLRLLDIHENKITGNLQDTLPQIPTLEALILRNNLLQGFIPSNISNLISLRILDLSWNNITGGIPREMVNLPRMIETQNKSAYQRLRSHSIYASMLYIPMPGDIVVSWKKYFRGLAVTNLDIYSLLDLSGNRISREIPASLGNLKALKVLNVSHNKILGHIPVSIGDLKNLESLDLSYNELLGSIPQSIVNLRQLSIMDVSNNKLTGRIPVGGQMTTINELNSYENNNGLCGIQIMVKCPEDIPTAEEREEEDERQSWFLWEGTWVGFPLGFFSTILTMGYFLNFLRLFKIW